MPNKCARPRTASSPAPPTSAPKRWPQRSKELEQLGRNHTTAGAAPLLADMEHSFQAARQALGALLEKET
jgi:hypothetical protein